MKALKLNLDQFDDIELYGWIASVEHFLDYYEVLPADRVSVAAVHLTGGASLWMCLFEQRYPKDPRQLFVDIFLQHFGIGDSSDFEAALTHHTHTGSLEDYHSQFIKLSCQVHGWSDL